LKRLQSDLILLLVALIWGTAFVFQRTAASDIGPFAFNAARCLLASLLLLPSALRARSAGQAISRPPYGWAAATGGVLFVGASLQQIGLRFTTAGNAAFLTSLYVVLVPLLLLGVYLGRNSRVLSSLHVTIDPSELPNWLTGAAVVVAAAGVYLLSGAGADQLGRQPLGDSLELAGAVFWAMHVILVGRVIRKMDLSLLMVSQFLVCGLLNLAGVVLFEGIHIQAIQQAAGAILYTGVISLGVAFTLQAVGQRHAPPSDAALILSMESVFAAISGYFLLGEQLQPLQAIGCGLIFGGILLAQSNRAPWLAPRSKIRKKAVD